MPEKKPSLAELLANQAAAGGRKRRKRSAPTQQAPVPQWPAPAPPGPIIDQRPAEMTRELLIKRFVTAFLGKGMSAAEALRSTSTRQKLTPRNSREMAYRLLQADDTKAELLRQAQDFRQRAALDEQWVHDQLLSMASCDIRDYVTTDAAGNVTEFKLHALSPEQARNIRGLRFKDGKVVDIRLIDRQGAVESVAKILKMFHVLDDSGLKELVADITQRMSAASKRLPRTFDHATGEEVE